MWAYWCVFGYVKNDKKCTLLIPLITFTDSIELIIKQLRATLFHRKQSEDATIDTSVHTNQGLIAC